MDIKAAKLLRTYKLKVEDIWAGSQEVRRRMELVSVPTQISSEFDRNHKQVMRMLDQLKDRLEKLDPTLQGAVATARKKIDYQIDKLRRKTGRAGRQRGLAVRSRSFSRTPAVSTENAAVARVVPVAVSGALGTQRFS